MKKLLGMSALALVLFAGCSSTASYAGQGEPNAEKGGEYYTVTFDKKGDDITNVKFDVVLPEGEFSTTSKKELSDKGEYGMKEASGKSWTEHVVELENYINENDKFPTLNEEGKDADGATGATITMSGFEEAFNAAKEA